MKIKPEGGSGEAPDPSSDMEVSSSCDVGNRHGPSMNAHVQHRIKTQGLPMSLLQQTDVYQGSEEKAARKHPEFALRFALALICVALALVLAGVMFPDAFRPSGEFSLIGP